MLLPAAYERLNTPLLIYCGLTISELCESLSEQFEFSRKPYLRRAAGYYKRANKKDRAIEIYKTLGDHAEVISLYREDNKVTELIQYLAE